MIQTAPKDNNTASASTGEILPFSEEWDVVQTLGEGAFGEVKLLIHKKTHDAVAVKVIDLNIPDCRDATRKEVLILRMLNHENIIGFIGQRREQNIQYVFLEYAAGGELFDRIEPDAGVPEIVAQNYFRQLIHGTEYLHSRGIAHRDLKPENLLLSETDTLKISDFGMATIFRLKGEERLLTKRCGTLPYVAPEVLAPRGEYHAEPADVWSCGVVLVALLAGELPWDSPTHQCPRFDAWRQANAWRRQTPFKKIDPLALDLLRIILNPNEQQRATIEKLKAHAWFNKDFTKRRSVVDCMNDCSQKRRNSRKRLRPSKQKILRVDVNDSTLRLPLNPDEENARLCFSQPESFSPVLSSDSKIYNQIDPVASAGADFNFLKPNCEWRGTKRKASLDNTDSLSSSLSKNNGPNSKCAERAGFSQPATFENMLISTQSQSSQPALNPMQKLVKRMTRFFVKVDVSEAMREINMLCQRLGYTTKLTSLCQLTVHATDSRRNNLIFKATAYETSTRRVLIDFRLSKGDGLDFKRIFVKLRDRLKSIIDQDSIDLWSFAGLNDNNNVLSIEKTTKMKMKGGVSSLSVDSLKL